MSEASIPLLAAEFILSQSSGIGLVEYYKCVTFEPMQFPFGKIVSPEYHRATNRERPATARNQSQLKVTFDGRCLLSKQGAYSNGHVRADYAAVLIAFLVTDNLLFGMGLPRLVEFWLPHDPACDRYSVFLIVF